MKWSHIPSRCQHPPGPLEAYFVGEFHHRVDGKGRLFLPRKLVEAIEAAGDRQQYILVLGLDPCLLLFTRQGFAEHVRHLRHSAHGPEEYRRVMRGMGSLASEQSPDNQGRIHLPEELRRRVGIDKDVVVLGAVDHVEIWDAGRWREEEKRAAERAYRESSETYFPAGQSPGNDGGGS